MARRIMATFYGTPLSHRVWIMCCLWFMNTKDANVCSDGCFYTVTLPRVFVSGIRGGTEKWQLRSISNRLDLVWAVTQSAFDFWLLTNLTMRARRTLDVYGPEMFKSNTTDIHSYLANKVISVSINGLWSRWVCDCMRYISCHIDLKMHRLKMQT